MPNIDVDRLRAAAQRYRERVGVDRGLAERATIDTQSAARSNYLSRTLSKERAKFLAVDATAKGEPARPADAVQQIARERIIGSSDLVDINFLELAISIGRAVARLKLKMELGTGFLVGPGLIMTNNHVIGSEDDALSAVAQFDYQENGQHELLPVHQYRLNPKRFFLTDQNLDFTVIAVEPVSDKGKSLDQYPWIQLIAQTGKAETGEPLNIIQHPNGGLKQIAFRENTIIEIPQGTADFLYYTTDTQPGSSGSPCFNDQWELIALHHSGVPEIDGAGNVLKRDKTPWRKGIDPDSLISWIANEGARTSAMVAAIQAASLTGEAADLRSKLIGSTPPNPIELSRKNLDSTIPASTTTVLVNQTGTSKGEATAMGQAVSLTIPLKITFSLGAAPAAVVAEPKPAVVAIQPPQTTDGAQEVTIDQDWSKRKGYDPNFLGIRVPLPQLSPSQITNTVEVSQQFRANGDKHLLNYYHYSVKMNKRRRSAWFSAGMIDGTRFIDFKRGKDKWFLDPRIDTKFQMGEELYVGDNTDRGHLTRFKDLSWGANMAEAVNGTNDSFHFTNCTLQLSGFNQSQSRWQGLEQFLLEQYAKSDHRKMVVITGPVFKTSDPKYKNSSMNYTAQIPLAFWKVCVLKRKDGSTAATAFTLGQEDITSLPGFEEKLDISTAQVTLEDLEQTTGLDFGDLKDNDVFAQSGDPGTLEAFRMEGKKVRVKPIEDFSQIVL